MLLMGKNIEGMSVKKRHFSRTRDQPILKNNSEKCRLFILFDLYAEEIEVK
jgi:hypothetical protein